jgi:hypothetical protein
MVGKIPVFKGTKLVKFFALEDLQVDTFKLCNNWFACQVKKGASQQRGANTKGVRHASPPGMENCNAGVLYVPGREN